MKSDRVVVDTNVVISAALRPSSKPGFALQKVLDSATWVANRSMIEELVDVFRRPKFDRYVERAEREILLSQFLDAVEIVPTVIDVTACRDPRDNHVLEAAVNGGADLIVTGDEDLLALNPFHDVRILTPTDYLK